MPGCTLPFKAGEILRVTDTYKDYDSESGSYIWHAMKTMDRGVYDTVREGSIPAEQRLVISIVLVDQRGRSSMGPARRSWGGGKAVLPLSKK